MGQKAKILVVEDQKNIRETLVDILELYNYDVLEADNGMVGSILALKEKPDLIFSDIDMPEMDGFEMLDLLNQCLDEELIPTFIFLTAKVERTDIRQGMNMGADDYITKPFNTVDVLEVIEAKLKKRKVVVNKVLSKERLHISEELRNNIQQLLARAHTAFKGFSSKISDLDEADQVAFKTGFESLKQASNDLRNYASNIGKIKHIDNIEERIHALVESLQGMENIDFEDSCLITSEMHPEVQTKIYRIIQESVINILKYAQASKVEVDLQSDENGIKLRISHDGIGLNKSITNSGRGLGSIKERANELGGDLKITSEKDAGNSVELTLMKA